MAKRTVGKGRGSVYAGGRVYIEGSEIPGDVEVGSHVFDDVEDVVGNQAVAPPVTAGDADAASGESTVEEVLEEAGVDAPSADAPDGEKAKSRRSS